MERRRLHAHTHSLTPFFLDLQTVNLVLRLLYRPVAEKLPVIHKTLGTDYDDKILPAIGNEVLKAVVVQIEKKLLHE